MNDVWLGSKIRWICEYIYQWNLIWVHCVTMLKRSVQNLVCCRVGHAIRDSKPSIGSMISLLCNKLLGSARVTFYWAVVSGLWKVTVRIKKFWTFFGWQSPFLELPVLSVLEFGICLWVLKSGWMSHHLCSVLACAQWSSESTLNDQTGTQTSSQCRERALHWATAVYYFGKLQSKMKS